MNHTIPPWITAGIVKTHTRMFGTVHPLLRGAYTEFLPLVPTDCFLYVFQGFRTPEAQNNALASGTSNASWGNSWHNVLPSLAFDLVPVWKTNVGAIEWDTPRTRAVLKELAGQRILNWGGNWSSPKEDIFHFQLPPEKSKPSDYGKLLDGYDILLTMIPKERRK